MSGDATFARSSLTSILANNVAKKTGFFCPSNLLKIFLQIFFVVFAKILCSSSANIFCSNFVSALHLRGFWTKFHKGSFILSLLMIILLQKQGQF